MIYVKMLTAYHSLEIVLVNSKNVFCHVQSSMPQSLPLFTRKPWLPYKSYS